MISSLAKAKEIFLDILFPPLCFHCRRYLSPSEHLLCATCRLTLIANSSFFCPACQARVADNKVSCHSNGFILGAAFSYRQPVIRSLIQLLKFRHYQVIAPFLGDLVADYLLSLSLNLSDFIIVPVPLGPARLRKRGFNQSDLIARRLSSRLSLPLNNDLVRHRETKPQTELCFSARAANLQNCFSVVSTSLQKRNIILVDDVFTTGATARAAVSVLKKNGARRLFFLVVAKT